MDFNTLASPESLVRVSDALTHNNFKPVTVATKEEALTKIRELIPAGATVNNGASKTLEEVGFIEFLQQGNHGWRNLHEAILAEADQAKQGQLRKEYTVSDYYLGSVHAVTEAGELIIASASGSQMPAIAYNAQNLILVVGAQKVVPTLSDALKRIEEHIVPLEDARMQQTYGVGTLYAKTLVLHKEHPMMQREVHVLFVNQRLGF